MVSRGNRGAVLIGYPREARPSALVTDVSERTAV